MAAYKLLARKNGDISIVEIVDTKKAFLTYMPVHETYTRKLFIAEQGTKWELFVNVDDATKWIMEGRPKGDLLL